MLFFCCNVLSVRFKTLLALAFFFGDIGMMVVPFWLFNVVWDSRIKVEVA